MEDIEVSLKSYHEMSAGILSETSSWTIDLSSMPRIIQELISRYFMEEMVCGSVNGGIKQKSQGYPLFKEQYVKKVVTKNNISKRQKNVFWLRVYSSFMKKNLYDVYVHLCQDKGEVRYWKYLCKVGLVVIANIVLHFSISCVNIFS